MVEQFRAGFDKLIQLNPSTAQYFRDNSLLSETIRLSHESASVPGSTTTPVGLGTNFAMFAEMYFDSNIQMNDVLIVEGKGWKVTATPDECRFKSEVYGKHVPVKSVSLSANNSITSFKIGSVNGVIIGTNITVTLPIGTDVTALSPVIVYNGKMIDKTGAQDFTNPVTYTVTAENLSTKSYIVTVVLA